MFKKFLFTTNADNKVSQLSPHLNSVSLLWDHETYRTEWGQAVILPLRVTGYPPPVWNINKKAFSPGWWPKWLWYLAEAPAAVLSVFTPLQLLNSADSAHAGNPSMWTRNLCGRERLIGNFCRNVISPLTTGFPDWLEDICEKTP